MDINEKLQEAGLTGNEAKVYLELLRTGKLSANQIAKNICMDRTLTYTVLNHLIDKGQVNYIIERNKKMFSCSNVENLLNPIKAKEAVILDLVKELKNVEKKKGEETEVNVYEGKEAVRNLMRELIRVKKVDAFGSTGRAYDLLLESSAIAKEAEKRRIIMRVIAAEKYKKSKFYSYKNLKVKFLDVESEATTSIAGDRVSIHLIKDKPIVIIIKNKHIAQSYKNYFEYLWKKAED